ncbi:MAG: hypothetical protein V4649_19580 [Bacteroidota bacterium]
MAVKNLYGLYGQLALAASSVATIIKVDATLAGAIVASGFVNGVDETYFAVTANNVYEVVKVTHVNGQNLTVVRGVESTAQAFPVGSALNFVVTAAAVLSIIGPITSTVQLTDSGMVTVQNTSGDIWNVDVPAPNFVGVNGVSILGAYPNYTFTYTPADCCGDIGGVVGGGMTNIIGTGIATAFESGGIAYVSVLAPAFVGAGGLVITGTWPNLTFTQAAGGGGGTVTSVAAGTGLTITGNPAVNPTASITNTGVVAGNYGGVVVTATGQISAVPATFNPISVAVAGTGIGIVRAGDQITISVGNAVIGTRGAVALVDHTDPFDPANVTEAMTPAAVAVAMATLASGSTTGANVYSGEASGDYSNTIAGSVTAIELAAGKKAIVYAEVTMINGATPLTPVDFGMAIFNASPSLVKANRKMNQTQQSMSFLIEGPIASTSFAILTTAVPGGSSIVSYSMYIQKLP